MTLYSPLRVGSMGYRFHGSIGAMKLAASGVNSCWRTGALVLRRPPPPGSMWPHGFERSPRGTERSPRRWPWAKGVRRSPGDSASAAVELASCASGFGDNGRSFREKRNSAASPERSIALARPRSPPRPGPSAGGMRRFRLVCATLPFVSIRSFSHCVRS